MRKVVLTGSDGWPDAESKPFTWRLLGSHERLPDDDVYDISEGIYDWWAETVQRHSNMTAEIRQMVCERKKSAFHRYIKPRVDEEGSQMAASGEERKNFLGIPVTGTINYADQRVPQKPLEELTPLMQALLDDPSIESFGWTQYTPYFNDGEPCVFSASGELSVTLMEGNGIPPCTRCDRMLSPAQEECKNCGLKNPSYDEDFYEETEGVEHNDALGRRVTGFRGKDAGLEIGVYIGPDEARYDRCLALEEAIGSGAFDNVLLEHFGDHCHVTVTKEAIRVSEYQHD
jgi:hypothetical protein